MKALLEFGILPELFSPISSALLYFSIAVIKHPDQGNLGKKEFRRAYDFRELESMITEKRYDGRTAENSHLDPKVGDREKTENG